MRANEPLFVLHTHLILNVLEIVIWRQIQFIAGRDIVMHELCSVLDQTESLIRVVLLASLTVNKVLLDVGGPVGQLFLLLVDLLLLFIITYHS